MPSNYLFLWFIFFFAFGLSTSYAQLVNFEDDFEDGDFTTNPAWSGDSGDFTVIDGSPNFLLRLNGDDTNGGVSYLSTPSNNITGYWEFYINLDFSPSGGNYALIFLMSDIADLEGPVNGYALRAGESGSDDVFRVIRYDNGSEANTVLSGTTDISGGGAFRVKVIRQSGGQWSLEVGQGYESITAAEGGTQADAVHTSAQYFGVHTTYTASRADLFTFDFKIDLPPFTVAKAAADSNRVAVTFSRTYEATSVQAGDFEISNGVGAPASVSHTDSRTVTLLYDNPLPSDKHTLTARDIRDLSGRLIANDASASFTVFGDYDPGDLLINEFMYDPPAGQPEYIEIKNLSDKFLNLYNWRIGDDSNTVTLSTDTLALPPESFLVISKDTSALFTLYGPRPYVEVSALPALNNSGDAARLISATGNTVDSLSYQPNWGGEKVALERRTDAAPVIYKENWGDSPAPGGGTPGASNQVAKDKQPPWLTGLDIRSDIQLQLAFNERVDSTAGNPKHYAIEGNSISSASQTASDILRLSLTSPLQNDRNYRLTITNVRDIFGNTISSYDTTFTYYEITAADSGDVFINEFSYDPAPGQTEYIEVYNPTSRSFDLQNWTLSDNRGEEALITGDSHILQPRSYAVLAPDNTLLQSHPHITLISLGSRFPALNNSGDDLVLKNGSGLTLDSLQFTAGWGGTEIPLERRTTAVAATYGENWGDAPRVEGSPGRENTIPEDTTGPEVEAAYAVDNTRIQLIFTERVTSSSATDFSNYRFLPQRSIQLISAREDSVTLFLSDPLVSDQSYTLTTQNLSDVFGNHSGSSTHPVAFLQLSEGRPGDVIINEIMANPDAGTAEFVELYNTTDKNIDLAGWSFGDAADETTFSSDIMLRAKSYLVLTGSASFAKSHPVALMLPGFPNLNNAGDALFIRSGVGTVIDSLYYRSDWSNDSANAYSLERKDPRAASNDSSNWTAHQSGVKHSAGGQNSSFREDRTPPEIIFANTRTDGRIEVRFSEFIRPIEGLRFSLNDAVLPVAGFDPANGNRIILRYSGSRREAAAVSVSNLADVRGNKTPAAEIALAYPLRKGDLVINEIMYNPLEEPDDNKPDQSEYIELYNTRGYALSLEGLVLHDAPDENGKVRKLLPASTASKWVHPRETVLLYAGESPAFVQSKLANFFDIAGESLQETIRIDRSSLSLASTGDAVYLADSTGTVIDSVRYDEEWHNPNVIDTRGVALERITPVGASNLRANWSSSVHSKGGTPKARNSIFQENPEQPQETGIRFAPNPFSPDGDGHEDNLIISYRLDQADYQLRVNIFDRYGRHIKELADGSPAGFEGQLIWDGRRDDGRRNRIGIYIIVFEAINSASGSDKAFKKTVVVARKLN